MRLFLISLLAIGSAQALSIGNPSRSAYWTYNPARGEFPVHSAVVQDNLRYFDNNGNERFVSYNYPEPVYSERQLSYVSDSSSPVFRAYAQADSSKFSKAREAHFRAWALQRYQALKCEMDGLRVEGKEPSTDMLLKFQPLEKIVLTADYSTIAELPEVKRLYEEHLLIWNAALNKNLQTAAGQSTYQQSIVDNIQGEIKTYSGLPTLTTFVTAGQTPEQKQAHEGHLRIHNEQVEHVRQLEKGNQQQFEQKLIEQQSVQAEALAELERANQEHLRLWNEAKLRTDQANVGYENAEKQQISALKHDQAIHHQQHTDQQFAEIQLANDEHLRLLNEANQRIQSKKAEGLTELERANQEHFRLWNQAKLRGEEGGFNLHGRTETENKEYDKVEKQQIAALKSDQAIQHQLLTKQKFAEIQEARDEYLRLVNEATLKIQAAAEHNKQIQQQNLKSLIPIAVVDTPEVIRAREEHQRLVNEAQLRVQIAKQQELKDKQQSIEQHIEEQPSFIQRNTDTVNKAYEAAEQQQRVQDLEEFEKTRKEHERLVNEATLKIQAAEEHIKHLESQQITAANAKSSIPIAVVDTPEVKQARKEHQRLVNEAKLRVQIAEQQEQGSFNLHGRTKTENKEYDEAEKQQIAALKHDQAVQHQLVTNQKISEIQNARNEFLRLQYESTQKLQAAEEHNKQIQQENLKSLIPIAVVDTPEVTRAREEHQRLVNEANLRVQIAELNAFQELKEYSKYGQQQQNTQELAEFEKTRDEHERLVNEATLKIQAAEEHIKQLEAQQIKAANLEGSIPIAVVDTPEVVRAREEHLRLVNEAKLRAQSVEQQELKYKQDNEQESHQVPLLKTHVQHQPIHYQQHQQGVYHHEQTQHIQDTPDVQLQSSLRSYLPQEPNKITEYQNVHHHTEPQSKSHFQQAHQQQKSFQLTSESHHHIGDTPEVKHAREEHLRIFNAIKSQNEEEAKLAEIKSSGIISQPQTLNEQLDAIKEEEGLKEEAKLLELESLREAERLQEEHKQLELESVHEAERLAEEQRQIKAEQMRLKLEEENRLEMERLLETKRLKEQQEELQANDGQFEETKEEERLKEEARLLELEGLREAQYLQEDHKQLELESIREAKQLELESVREAERLAEEQRQIKAEQLRLKLEEEQRLEMERLQEIRLLKEQEELQKQQQLKTEIQDAADNDQVVNRIQHSFQQQPQQQQQIYTHNPFLKTSVINTPIVYYPSNNAAVQSRNTVVPVYSYVQSYQQPTGAKHQHVKDDFIKTKFSHTGSTQPADSAVALLALERATNQHFRAHELALEQLRLARLHNPDCN